MVCVSSVLCWGPCSAWQRLSLTHGEGGILLSCPQVPSEPCHVFELSGSCLVLSIYKISDVLCWLWSGTRGKETGQPHQCRGSTKRLQRAWPRCCRGLLCCLCSALCLLPALLSHRFRWKSQSHRGDIMAPLSEVHWQRRAASLWQLLQDLAASM